MKFAPRRAAATHPPDGTDDAGGDMSAGQAMAALREFSRGYERRLRFTAAYAVLWAVAEVSTALVMAPLVDELDGAGRASVVGGWLAAWVALAGVCAEAVRRRDAGAARTAADVGRDLRVKVADRELRAINPRPALQVTAFGGVDGVMQCLVLVVPCLIGAFAGIAASVVCAFVLDWRIACVGVVAIGPIAWLNGRLNRRIRLARTAHMMQFKAFAAEADRFLPAGREAIAALRARPQVIKRFELAAAALRGAEEASFAAANYYPAIKLLGALLAAGVVGVAYLLSDVSLGTKVAFVTLSIDLVRRMVEVVVWLGGLARHTPSIAMVCDALAQPAERANGEPVAAPAGRLELRNVTASYPDGRRGANQLALTVTPGEIIALVGPSGAGKSTIARLLTGDEVLTLEPDGSVLVDGTSVSQLNLDRLREHIVRTPQGSWAFPGTVAENLLEPEGATQEDLEWACRLVGLHEQIAKWPREYATEIGLPPHGISGGEAQRLSVARALLRVRRGNARVMILDEATAALDPEAVDGVMDRILAELERLGITVLVITHKLPVHVRVTRVAVISGGRVIEDGDPRRLAADPATAYARMIAGRDVR